MQVRTVRASSVKEAMEQIKDELGSDAVLLHTKKYREGGVLGGAEMIEVTAAVDEAQARMPHVPSAYVPPAAPILPSNVLNQRLCARGGDGNAGRRRSTLVRYLWR